MVVTRFAPSPTGMLHIGGARTALFNYLFAKNQNGKFLLRIEDTDKARSSNEAIDEILNGLKWLNITWDDDIVIQSLNAQKHRQIAKKLVEIGAAYYCFEKQETEKVYDKEHRKSPWRELNEKVYPKDVNPVIRLKVPTDGITTLKDIVQGTVIVKNEQLQDVILLKSDNNPTYMLAAVCDDYEMNVSHIIRGDDHLTNAFLQIQIYKALNWPIPEMAHIPLIHGQDGQKLSKRHGALSVSSYKEAGYLPDALCNYLVKLGWSHGDQEIFSKTEMQKLFHVKAINKAPARLDIDKLKSINAHYIKNSEDEFLAQLIICELEKIHSLSPQSKVGISKGVKEIKLRAKLLPELCEIAKIYTTEIPVSYNEEAIGIIAKVDSTLVDAVLELLSANHANFSQTNLQESFKALALQNKMTLGDIAAPIRALITGTSKSASIFGIMEIIGLHATRTRIINAIGCYKIT